MIVDGIYIEGNTFANQGFGQSAINRGRDFAGYTTTSPQTNMFIKNNLFYNSEMSSLHFNDDFANKSNITLDYNLYYSQSADCLIQWNQSVCYAGRNFSDYQTIETNDAHSQIANPLLDSSFRPYSDSPACNMSESGSYVGALPCLEIPYPKNISFMGNTPNNNSVLSANNFEVTVTNSANTSASSIIADFNNSLVGWWRMNNDLNDYDIVKDWSSYGNNGGGVILNQFAYGDGKFNEAGKFGGAYEIRGVWIFNGSDYNWIENYIQIPKNSSFEPENKLSVIVWIKTPANYTQEIISNKGAGETGYSFSVNSGRVFFNVSNGSQSIVANGTTYVNDSSFHMVTGIFDGQNVKIYLDGVLKDTQSFSSTTSISYGSVDLFMGQTPSATNRFNGTIDEVAIFSRELSSDEILAAYNASANPYSNNFIDLTNGTYTFKLYSQDENGQVASTETRSVIWTPQTITSVSESSSSSGGGSGGIPITPPAEFSLDQESIEMTLVVNRLEFNTLKISNDGDSNETFSLSVEELEDLIVFEEDTLAINPGESRNVEFEVTAPREPGIYTGKILVISGSKTEEILVVINVKTEKSLFDITIIIPQVMKSMNPGSDLEAQITLLEMGLLEEIDVTLNYIIKDFSGNLLLTESETIAVYDQKVLQKEFETSSLPLGDYVLGVELIYPDGVAVASSQFKVQEKFRISNENLAMAILIFVMIFIVIIISLAIKRYKRIEKHLIKKKK